MGRAVLAQGALSWALAPAALEVWVSLEAKPTALTHGPTLVEVNCRGQRQEALRDVKKRLEALRDPGMKCSLSLIGPKGNLVPLAIVMQRRLKWSPKHEQN
jgi:hypothetical protein